MNARLNRSALDTAGAGRPGYDLTAVRTGIVHLGLGAFHRAHLAAYVDQCLGADARWGIAGVSLRSAAAREALAPQDGLYTIAIRSNEATEHRIIGALTAVLTAPEQPEAVLAALTAPGTRIVSLTITEKGYCHDPATGRLNTGHPDISADLLDEGRPRSAPRSAIGWLIRALRERRAAGAPPFTLLCCDNLPANGATLRRVLLDFVAESQPEEVSWFEDHLACPCTMVDRIVPATTDEDRAAVSAAIGLRDAWPVVTEPFSQFVVEDHFPAGRPDWEGAGVTMTSDVAPFEKMKLRMLNGAHSTLAYLGCLAGDETVADAMADPAFRRLIHDLMSEEAAPTLNMPGGVDLTAYRDELLARFANRALRHRTRQIAMDGSQKLPQRLLGTIRDRLDAGAPFDRLALGVAAWMRYAAGRDEHGAPIDVRDPMAARFAAIAAGAETPADLAAGVFQLREIFGDLPDHPAFTHPVIDALTRLTELGAREVIARMGGG